MTTDHRAWPRPRRSPTTARPARPPRVPSSSARIDRSRVTAPRGGLLPQRGAGGRPSRPSPRKHCGSGPPKRVLWWRLRRCPMSQRWSPARTARWSSFPARAPREDARGPVVVAAAPWTGDGVITLAFAEASGQRAPLLALRAWSEPASISAGRERTGSPHGTAPRNGSGRTWSSRSRRGGSCTPTSRSGSSAWRTGRRAPRRVLPPRPAGGGRPLPARCAVGGLSESPVAALLRASRCPVLWCRPRVRRAPAGCPAARGAGPPPRAEIGRP